MTKKITQKRLENIALFYLQRYETTSFKLKEVLLKRIKRTQMQGEEVEDAAFKWIDEIVQKMQNLGYVDDNRYAENQWRILSSQGKSVRYIAQKLKQAGINDLIIEDLISSQELSSDELDLQAAEALIKKKKLGKYHPEEIRAELFKKDLGVLARAGFSYQIARQALEED